MILHCLYSLCGMDKAFSFHASFTASYNDFTESAPALTTIYLWPVGDASQILYFHYTAEHKEQDHIVLEEENSREEQLCVCAQMLKTFTETPRSGHALPFADSHGSGSSGFNRGFMILEEKKMIIWRRKPVPPQIQEAE